MRLLYVLKKEFRVMTRDIHSLGVLFVLPVIFILIMSLAMRDLFQSHSDVKIDMLVLDQDGGTAAQNFLDQLQTQDALTLHRLADTIDVAQLTDRMYANDIKFSLILGAHFSHVLNSPGETLKSPVIRLLVLPTVGRQTHMILQNTFIRIIENMRFSALLPELTRLPMKPAIPVAALMHPADEMIATQYVYKSGRYTRAPNSVQQSVPAWLVFSMFFVVIPISNTFISERNFGTLLRLKSIRLPRGYMLLAKILPFFIVNLIQLGLMLAVGVFVVPLLGGDALSLGHSVAGLLLITMGVSFGSICMALFVAAIAKTTEHATTIGGLLNIVLAAIGGIMVPKFVMPALMRRFANLSPMSWGLEGFLDIFLRNGGIADVLPEFGLLLAFGLIMLLLAAFYMKRKFA